MWKYNSTLLIFLIFITACGKKENKLSDKSEMSINVNIERTGFIQSDKDIKLYYDIRGKGEDTLVMVNGGPGLSLEVMAPDWKELENDYTMIFYDQRGSGRSTLPDTTTIDKTLHINRFVEDLEELRRYFSLKEMTLIGHSGGTMIIANYVIKYETNVKKILFIGSVPPFKGDFAERVLENEKRFYEEGEFDKYYEYEKQFLSGRNFPESCIEMWNVLLKTRVASGIPVDVIKGNHCLPPWESAVYGYKYSMNLVFDLLGDWDYRPYIQNIEVPVLIIHGKEEVFPMDMIEEWERSFPNARLEKIEGAAHFPHVEKPTIVWPIIRKFLKE